MWATLDEAKERETESKIETYVVKKRSLRVMSCAYILTEVYFICLVFFQDRVGMFADL